MNQMPRRCQNFDAHATIAYHSHVYREKLELRSVLFGLGLGPYMMGARRGVGHESLTGLLAQVLAAREAKTFHIYQ